MRILIVMLMLLVPTQAVAASSWSPVGTVLGTQCRNYCDVSGDRYATNDALSSDIGHFWYGKIGSSPAKAISRDKMRSAGLVKNGHRLEWIRTIGIDGNRAVLHVANDYWNNKTGFVPVYAERVSGEWRVRGLIRVNGSVLNMFSSSMAYSYRNGVHWMIQDYNGLRAYRSTNGIDYKPVGGNIATVTGDSSGVWPDMLYHGGRWHVVHVGGNWLDERVRHISSADMVNWRVENKSALYSHKGCNLFVRDGKLACHSHGYVWRSNIGGTTTSDPEPDPAPTSGESCSSLALAVSGRDAAVSWSGTCIHKLVNTTNGSTVFFGKVSDGKTHAGLPYASYKALAREPVSGAPYTSKAFTIDGGGTTTTTASSGSICSSPEASGGSRSITVSWSGGGKCIVKTVGPTGKWLSGVTSGATISGLKAGTYKVRVKPSGGVYQDVTGVIVR